MITEKDEHYQQVKTSFALSDIILTPEDTERMGRVLAGQITMDEAVEEIRQQFADNRAQSGDAG